MKSDHLKESKNIEDRRGQSGGSYSSGRSGGNLGGGILQILLSPGSFKSKLILILVLIFLSGGAGLSGLFDQGQTTQNYNSGQVTRQSNTQVSDGDSKFVSQVLGTTEDFWGQTFQKDGRTYHKPTLVFYTGQTRTGCGVGQASAGPFYCPTDQKIYLDISFYKEGKARQKKMPSMSVWNFKLTTMRVCGRAILKSKGSWIQAILKKRSMLHTP